MFLPCNLVKVSSRKGIKPSADPVLPLLNQRFATSLTSETKAIMGLCDALPGL